MVIVIFFYNHTATTEIYTLLYTLSLHDALPISPPREWRESNCAADRKPGSTPWVTPCLGPASSRQAYGPDGRANCPGDVVAVSGDSDDAALLFGDRRGRAMLAPQRPQVKHAPVGRQQERAGDREAPGIGPVRLAHPHDTAEIVDVVGTAGPSPKGPQIDHAGLFRPQKRVTAAAHDLGPIVNAERHAGRGAKGTEIPQAIGRRPQKCVRPAGARLRQAHHRARVVHVVRDAHRPAPSQAAQVD